MLRKVDRLLLRVPALQSAVNYYRDVLGLTLARQDANLAVFKLLDHHTELVLHVDPDLPPDATYYLVDDVRDLYKRRAELKLTFVSPPSQVARGYRATVKDPFGTVLLLLDRTTDTDPNVGIEDAKPAGALFGGLEERFNPKAELLSSLYEKIGRTADDLPYTPHFESLYSSYANAYGENQPTRQEVWRHLLNLRKRGKLAKHGEARSQPPEVSPEAVALIRQLVGEEIGRRDRLPYTKKFDDLVDEFNKTQPRPISPHLVWRLVATIAK